MTKVLKQHHKNCTPGPLKLNPRAWTPIKHWGRSQKNPKKHKIQQTKLESNKKEPEERGRASYTYRWDTGGNKQVILIKGVEDDKKQEKEQL